MVVCVGIDDGDNEGAGNGTFAGAGLADEFDPREEFVSDTSDNQ